MTQLVIFVVFYLGLGLLVSVIKFNRKKPSGTCVMCEGQGFVTGRWDPEGIIEVSHHCGYCGGTGKRRR